MAEYIQGLSKEMVEAATDEDIKALTIANFQMLQEVVQFCRDLQEGIEKMQKSGLGGLMGGNGLLPPTLTPDQVRQMQRSVKGR